MTEDKFWAFEAVRVGGLTNMMDTKKVIRLADEANPDVLDRDDCSNIRKNYSKYAEQWKGEA